MSAKSPIQLLACLRRHAVDSPDRLAVLDLERRRSMSWSQLGAEANEVANRLRAALPPGSTVLFRCSTGGSFHAGFLGALLAHMSIFPVPLDVAPIEYESLKRHVAAGGEMNRQLDIRALPGAAPSPWNECSLLLQSSGTTGLPKVVRRTTASLDACASNMVEALQISSADRFLACVPLCHSYGIEHGLLAPLLAGASVHLAQGFDLPVVRAEIAGAQITAFPAVPSIYEMIANLNDADVPLERLRLAYSAGGPLPQSIRAKIADSCDLQVAQLYGATELGSITFTPPADPAFDPASVGRPMRGVEFRIDVEGQLLARSPSMMAQYVGEESPFVEDGFFPTGDLGHVDARGNIFIDGRLKLLIDVGGLKVNPAEIEDAMSQHPEVVECVVVPMRLSETVSRIKAIIAPRDPKHPPSAEHLRLHAKQRLAGHKIPRLFEFRNGLPRSDAGKILRHLLVEST